MRTLCLAIISLVLLASCEKKSDSTKPAGIFLCEGPKLTDSAEIIAALEGSWTLTHYTRPYTPVFINADKSITAKFNADKSFEVKEKGSLIAEGTCSIRKYGTYFDLSTSTANEFIGGPISICGNNLLFSKSFFDGSDYLYAKAN